MAKMSFKNYLATAIWCGHVSRVHIGLLRRWIWIDKFCYYRVACVPRPWRRLPSWSLKSTTPAWRWTSIPTRGSAKRLPLSQANLCETRLLGMPDHQALHSWDIVKFAPSSQIHHPLDETSSTQDSAWHFHQTARRRTWEERQLCPRAVCLGCWHDWDWPWDQGNVEDACKSC